MRGNNKQFLIDVREDRHQVESGSYSFLIPIVSPPPCTSFTLVIRRSANTRTHLEVPSSSRGNPSESICEQRPQCPLNKSPWWSSRNKWRNHSAWKNPFLCFLFVFNHKICLVCKILGIVRYSDSYSTVGLYVNMKYSTSLSVDKTSRQLGGISQWHA